MSNIPSNKKPTEQPQHKQDSIAPLCSALVWTQEKPTIEGAYFWRRSSNCHNPLEWCLYYVCRLNTGEDMNVFEAGTEVYFPKGGQWAILAQNAEVACEPDGKTSSDKGGES